jgi:hypothetical protein
MTRGNLFFVKDIFLEHFLGFCVCKAVEVVILKGLMIKCPPMGIRIFFENP